MSETKFTPGPWRLLDSKSLSNAVAADSGARSFDGDTGYRVVAIYQACEPTGKYEAERINKMANAHLIVAAPMLYEALQQLLDAADESDGCQYGTLSTSFVRDIAEAALKLARGEL